MKYRILKFEHGHEGRQSICTYIEILDDDVIEPDEFFSVQLSSTDPAVTLTRDRATIRIVDDDGDEVLPTENSTPTNCACPTASATLRTHFTGTNIEAHYTCSRPYCRTYFT